MQVSKEKPVADSATSEQVLLTDGQRTTTHVVRYRRDTVQPRLTVFKEETQLPVWCRENGVEEALVGGFFFRSARLPLGEVWLQGQALPSVPFTAPWHASRGSLHINLDSVEIDYRHCFPDVPTGDLLQAGPLLVKDGASLLVTPNDNEGFSAAWHQFDSDITDGRHPRAAFGMNNDYFFSVVCDGRSEQDAGMTLAEIAEIMGDLGCTHALNLDGGGSASLVTQGKMINMPRSNNQEHPEGRPIYSAITFTTT
jgi:hypothetical protein